MAYIAQVNEAVLNNSYRNCSSRNFYGYVLFIDILNQYKMMLKGFQIHIFSYPDDALSLHIFFLSSLPYRVYDGIFLIYSGVYGICSEIDVCQYAIGFFLNGFMKNQSSWIDLMKKTMMTILSSEKNSVFSVCIKKCSFFFILDLPRFEPSDEEISDNDHSISAQTYNSDYATFYDDSGFYSDSYGYNAAQLNQYRYQYLIFIWLDYINKRTNIEQENTDYFYLIYWQWTATMDWGLHIEIHKQITDLNYKTMEGRCFKNKGRKMPNIFFAATMQIWAGFSCTFFFLISIFL